MIAAELQTPVDVAGGLVATLLDSKLVVAEPDPVGGARYKLPEVAPLVGEVG